MAGKSILVIDTPKCCVDCDLMYDYLYCSANQEERNMTQMEEGRPKGCPLRPLPEKKLVSYHDDLYGDVEKNYTNIGWNLCLEELEK